MERKQITEMVCILDKSGSMHGREEDTIKNFNQMLKEQKKHTEQAYVTTALFSDQCSIFESHVPLCAAKELTEQEYYAEGNTALFDAIGRVFSEVSRRLDSAGEEVEERVLVFIITDGLDNAA